jgi:dipeptidyl aminopeptidase/acylaminoacyl peptidase
MERAPYGTWRSPLGADRVAVAGVRYGQPQTFRGDGFWVEGRPEEGGRQVLVCATSGGVVRDLTPAGLNVRSTVHEYGGGDYAVGSGGGVFALAEGGARVFSWEAPSEATALTGALADARYADFAISPDGDSIACVEEVHREGREAQNRLVLFGRATGSRHVVAEDHDFVSSPVFSPDGDRLAYLTWDHPRMPWQGTELRVCGLSGGEAQGARRVAGGPSESIFQPTFAPDGTLVFVSDRSGWWNLYALRGGASHPLAPRAEEFGRPQWVFGMTTYAFSGEEIVCRVGVEGSSRLARLDPTAGTLEFMPLPVSEIDGLAVSGPEVWMVAAGAHEARGVAVYNLENRSLARIRGGGAAGLADDVIAVAEARQFATAGEETAYGFFYAPVGDGVRGPEGESPPLLVRTHGGPTSASGSALDLSIQYFTTRGFAVFDVNYRGSTGYGRAYWEALAGQWGIVDVEDCAAAATDAVARGLADPSRLAIRGGSAGGYTTLCALTFGDVFHAGASYYGIGDLELLARDTHKFESHYTDWLVGPYPEARALYRERSPLHFARSLRRPVIFFQGLRDRVVPPNQAETMVAALAAAGVDHEYVTFANEGHGFRDATSLVTALERELGFYRRVFDLGG